MKIKNFLEFKNYLIMYFVIVFSGLEFFTTDTAHLIYFILSLFLFLKRGKKLDGYIVTIVLYTFIVFVFQKLHFQRGKVFTFFTFTSITVLTPYFIFKLIGPKFPKYYIKIIYYYSIISLGFWALTNIFPSFNYFISSLPAKLGTAPIGGEQFILYTYSPDLVGGVIRNCGPFHEPGAFCVFIVLALVFNFMKTNNIWGKVNVVFMITILTTISTAGYLALIVLLFTYYINRRITRLVKVILVMLIITFSTISFFRINFLYKKIYGEWQYQTTVSLDTPTSGRFLGARKAIVVLKRYPLIGRGLLSATLARIDSDEGAGYGIMKWSSRIGIIGAILYLFYLYRAVLYFSLIYNFNKKNRFLIYTAIILVLFPQKHISSAVVFMILFTGISYSGQRKITNTRILRF